ncbi:MAG: methyltransferase domain-containing protein [Candidatus Caldarchaeum sp.]|nr:methyltransferase domain-containing protein [Candidatus Caldarchaeum sp.]MCX8201853.1 methyltransferase domain-containing protein [Candidatus Caldarchaeum sp.]MDW8062678.1 methyltransferase domain-containing protein [Candidatus Caldarchaeum sp.]MDW8435837.1 methyltransferase domain-containing protein [Candidatus Caldarchaeum sp.]
MNKVYTPREDSFLTMDCVGRVPPLERAVEVGCGPGVVMKTMLERCGEVVGIDVDLPSLREAMVRLADDYGRVHLVNASFLPFRDKCLDLVVANPPYLPSEPEFYDPSIHGGPTGVEASIQIVQSAARALKKNGLLVMTASSLSDVESLLLQTQSAGFSPRDRLEFKSFFETVFCFIFSLERV